MEFDFQKQIIGGMSMNKACTVDIFGQTLVAPLTFSFLAWCNHLVGDEVAEPVGGDDPQEPDAEIVGPVGVLQQVFLAAQSKSLAAS